MDILKKIFFSLYDYVLDILPFFVIAVLITSLLQGFTSLSWLRVFLKKGKTAPIYTGFLGGLLPLCSCSMLPVANLINSMSRSYAPVLSFLIVAPVVSPITLILTYGYFGLPMTVLRLFGTLFFALLFAYAMELFFKKPSSLPLSMGGTSPSGWKSFGTHFRENFFGIGKYLLLGIVIASLIKTLIPPELIRPIAGSFASYPLVSFSSIPIYVCSGEEVPIAKALKDIGFSSGASLTFMLGGTGICMPTIIATLRFLPRTLVIAYVVFWLLFSMVMGFFYDLFLWEL